MRFHPVVRALDKPQPRNRRGGVDFCAKHRNGALDGHFLELALDHEFEREQLGGAAGNVVHRPMVFQVIEALRFAVLAQVGRAGTGDLAQAGDAFADQGRVAQRAGAQHAVDAFGDQVDKTVGLADRQFDVRVSRHEWRQGRDHEVPGQSAVQVDPQAAFRRHATKRQLSLFQLRQQLHATRVVGLAIQRRPHLARAALQQTRAQPGFELVQRVGQGRARQVQVIRRQGEAAALINTHEHLHRFDLIHAELLTLDCWRLLNSQGNSRAFIGLSKHVKLAPLPHQQEPSP